MAETGNMTSKQMNAELGDMTSDQGKAESSDVTSIQGKALSEESSGVDLEPIMKRLGSRGRYQTIQLILNLFASFGNYVAIFAVVFIGYKPDYQCNKVDNFTELQIYHPDDVSNFTPGDVQYHQCSIDVTINSSGTPSTHSLPCVAGVNFSMPSHTSFLTEWSLVCDRSALTELTQTGYFAGQAVGSVLLASVADRCGRRWVYVVCALGCLTSMVSTALVTTYHLLLLCRIATGLFQAGNDVSAYTMMMELLPHRWRHLTSVLDSLLWSLSCVFLATVAYCLQGLSWRYLALAYASVYAYSLLLPWFLDESLRWLLATGDVPQAERILRKACRLNGKDFDTIRPLLHKQTLANVSPAAHSSETDVIASDPEDEVTTVRRFSEGDVSKVTKDVDTIEPLRQKQTVTNFSSAVYSRKIDVGIANHPEDEVTTARLISEEDTNKVTRDTFKPLLQTQTLANASPEAHDRETDVVNDQEEATGFISEEDTSKVIEDEDVSGDCVSEEDRGVDGNSNQRGVLLRDAKDSNKQSKNSPVESHTETFSAKYTALDLFRHRTVFVPFLVCTAVWMTDNMYYYATMLGSASLSGNRFVNFGLLGVMQIPSTLLALFLTPRFKRRTLGFLFGLVAGCFLLLSVALMALGGGAGLTLTLATVAHYVGMFSLTGSYILLFVYGMEVFPTAMRSVGLGTMGCIIQTTDMAAPFFLVWAEETPWAPGVVVGCLCCLASASIWLLPETRHRKLPDTVEEMQTWTNGS